MMGTVRRLVDSPERWRWGGYRFYALDEAGPVLMNVGWTRNLVSRPRGSRRYCV